MIEEKGKVVAVKGDLAWVETLRQSACDSCSAKSGCGHSALAKLGQKTNHLEASCDLDVMVGDQVVVGVPEDVMVKSSILAYLMPLITMIGFALMADAYFSNEGITALFAIAGLAAGFMLLRWHFRRNQHDQRYQPVVLRRDMSASMGSMEPPACR